MSLHAQRHVADELLLEARLDLAGGDLVAVFARQRRGVDAERDRHRGLVDRDHGQRARVLEIGERLADRHLGDPGHGDDLPGPGLRGVDAVERVGDVQLGHLRALDRPVGAAPRDLLALADGAVAHAADRQPADVRGGVEVGHERLQRVLGVVGRRGDVLEQQVQQRREVLLRDRLPGLVVQRGDARLGVAVDDRELDLVLVGVEVEEQLVHLVDHLRHARVGAVDLVDDEDHRQPRLERLAQHEARLRQRALGGVHEQQHAVDHRQPALHLAAEVGVPGRVDDVQLDVPVAKRGVLGEDRDALLALEVHRVEHPRGHVLAHAERARLPQHGVDQRGLAVVDVGDDRDVADVISGVSTNRRG